MVTIIGYKECVSQEGKPFYALVLQGDLDIVKSQETGNFYFTANKMQLSTTFNEAICHSFIGKTLPGNVKKVPCAEYEYLNKETGETVTLSHTYQYVPEQPANAVQEPNAFQANVVPFGMAMAA